MEYNELSSTRKDIVNQMVATLNSNGTLETSEVIKIMESYSNNENKEYIFTIHSIIDDTLKEMGMFVNKNILSAYGTVLREMLKHDGMDISYQQVLSPEEFKAALDYLKVILPQSTKYFPDCYKE